MSQDQRRAHRYRVTLPVQLENGNGRTRDVSSSGVFFETDESFSAGAPVRFSMVLEHIFESPVRLDCTGAVVRVERRDGKMGVAATITSCRIEPVEHRRGKELARREIT